MSQTQTQSIPPLRVLAVTRKPRSASFEQRIKAYVDPLAARGITIDCLELPHPARGQRRALDRLAGCEVVWWQRHLLAPWWLPRLRRRARRIVFDFDDPLDRSATGGGRRSLTRRMRFALMLRRCDVAVAASPMLADLARPHCPRVHVVPMAVDLPRPRRAPPPGPVQLLWLGSAATQPYLTSIRAPLERLGAARPDLSLRLVAHASATFGRLTVDHRPWSPREQDAALGACHIGLCPMPDTIWTRGKCPYKVLQYMAHAMPWAGSPVGQNVAMAGAGEDATGLCAADDDQWLGHIERLTSDDALRARLGAAGRRRIEREHDRTILTDRIAAILRAAS